jgi:hypothetical protein
MKDGASLASAGSPGKELRMSVFGRLAWIAAGYGLAIAAGVVAVSINEMLIPADVSQSSGGMVAFGDMILFVLAVGFFSLAPTWFLLKLLAEKAPRPLLIGILLLAVTGPLSWAAVVGSSGGAGSNLPIKEIIGALVALGAIPRIVLGPIVVAVEFLALFLFRDAGSRKLLAAAMLMDVIPMGLFTLHMVRATHA